MAYQDFSGSFVHLARLVVQLICGMTLLTIVSIGIFKIVLTRLREAEMDKRTRAEPSDFEGRISVQNL
jgi:hypothetical protein